MEVKSSNALLKDRVQKMADIVNSAKRACENEKKTRLVKSLIDWLYSLFP